jgi:hypothetical protein
MPLTLEDLFTSGTRAELIAFLVLYFFLTTLEVEDLTNNKSLYTPEHE